jgi:very-short-patch-repair endonuclease
LIGGRPGAVLGARWMGFTECPEGCLSHTLRNTLRGRIPGPSGDREPGPTTVRPIHMANGRISADPGVRTDRRELLGLLADQDGIITAAQAKACGLTIDAIKTRVRTGLWERVGSRTYLSREHVFGDSAKLRAAVACTGGVAHGSAAAWWHGVVTELDPVIGISVPRSAHNVPYFVGELGLRRRHLLDQDVEVLRGLAVTRLPLTLLDCVTARSDAPTLLDRALQTGRVTPGGLHLALDRNAGRTGMAQARRIVRVVESDTESEAERRFARLLKVEGISGYTTQLRHGRFRADFAWESEKLVVEVDGWAFHKDAVRFQADHDKRNAFGRAGWTVLAFTWHDIDTDPIGTVESVVAVLRERRARIS